MTPAALTTFREAHGYTRLSFAGILGIDRSTLRRYEEGSSTIPPYIALACAALAYGLPPMGETR